MDPVNGPSVESGSGTKEERHCCRLIIRLIAPFIILVWGIFIVQRNREFIQNASTTLGELIVPPERVVKIVRGYYGDTMYYEYRFRYRIVVDGTAYSGHDTVLRSDSLIVYYDVRDPHRNRLTLPDVREGWIWIWGAVFLGIILTPATWRGPTHTPPETEEFGMCGES